MLSGKTQTFPDLFLSWKAYNKEREKEFGESNFSFLLVKKRTCGHLVKKRTCGHKQIT